MCFFYSARLQASDSVEELGAWLNEIEPNWSTYILSFGVNYVLSPMVTPYAYFIHSVLALLKRTHVVSTC